MFSSRNPSSSSNPYVSSAYSQSRAGPIAPVVDSLEPNPPRGIPNPSAIKYGPSTTGLPTQPSSIPQPKDAPKGSEGGEDMYKMIIIKATRQDTETPKQKWVSRIIDSIKQGGSISNRSTPVGAVFYHLRQRLSTNEWLVVLKTLAIFHHIFRVGNQSFTKYIASSSRDLFQLHGFLDTSNDGRSHMKFIHGYGAYLEQWCAMKATLDFPKKQAAGRSHTKIIERFRSASKDELYTALPMLIDTVEKLLELDFGGQIRFTKAGIPAIEMLLSDFNLLWDALCLSMTRLLDIFFDIPQNEAATGFDLYKRFTKIVDTAGGFVDTADSLGRNWSPPDLTAVSTNLAGKLEDYVENGTMRERIESEDEQSVDEYHEPEPEEEPEYYSPDEEEEHEAPPPPPPKVVTPPRSPSPELSESEASSEEDSEEEEESEEEVEEEEQAPPAPSPPPQPPAPKAFDPLTDLLGIGEEAYQSKAPAYATSNGQVTVYDQNTARIRQRATFENTLQDRVNNVKQTMNSGGRSMHGQNRGHVGSMGMNNAQNMQLALINQQQANMYATQYYQSQNYQTQMHRQQQMMMVAYQTQRNNQMALMQMQQQQQQYGQMGMMGSYVPAPRGDNTVPAMQAERNTEVPRSYRVKKSTKPTRVNASDSAFGPLLDQLKR